MGKTDTIFLVCVLAFAGLLAAHSISQAIPRLPGATSVPAAALGAAGQARDVDTTRLKELLKRRSLSDHEAEFYEPVD
jgi:hypothetical protein